MRRSIALITLVAFLVSIVVSGAASVLPDSPYINSIPEKVKQFDLGKYDYRTTVVTNDVPITALLRQSGSVTELNISELVKLQLNGRMLVLQIPGGKYSLDLAALLQEFQSRRFSRQEMQQDGNEVLSFLQRFALQVLLPFVEIQQRPDGFSFHLQADMISVYERLYSFLDAEMQGQTLSRLFNRYQPVLRLLIPGMPETYESLLSLWNTEKNSIRERIRYTDHTLSLNLNLEIRTEWRTVSQIISHGSLMTAYGSYDYSFEYQNCDDSKLLRMNLNEHTGNRSVEILRLDIRNSSIFAQISTDKYRSYQLSLNFDEETVNGTIRSTWREDETWSYLITASQDRNKAMHYTVTPARDGLPFSMSGILSPHEVNAEIHYYRDIINAGISTGTDYLHLYLNSDSYQADSYYANLWIYKQLNRETRIDMDCRRMHRNRTVMSFRLNCVAGPNHFRLTYSGNPYGTRYTDSATLNLDFRNSLILNIEISPGRMRQDGYTAYQLHLKQEDHGYAVNFDYPVHLWIIHGEGKVALDSAGRIGSIVGEAVVTSRYDPEYQETQRIVYSPGNLTLILTQGIYSVTKTVDTADKLTYIVSGNGRKLYDFTSKWDQDDKGHSFSVALTGESGTLFKILIESVGKTEIKPVTTEDATAITPEYLLQELWKNIFR